MQGRTSLIASATVEVHGYVFISCGLFVYFHFQDRSEMVRITKCTILDHHLDLVIFNSA